LHISATATTKELRRIDIGRAQNLCLAFSSDSRLLAAGFWSGKGASVLVWELATGKQLCRIDGLSQPPVELTFTPDGKRLLGHSTWGVVPNLRLDCWEVATGRECKGVTLASPQGQVRLGPDSRILAVPTSKGLDLWELATMQIRATLPALRTWPSEMAFSANGALFFVADTAGPVLIYDAYTGRLLGRLTGHRGQVVAFAFSANGRRLATASQDTTVLIWDLSRYQEKARVRRLLSETELTKQWQALAAEASTAGPAIAALRATPDQAIAFLRQHLQPFRARDTAGATQWIRDLDSPRFSVRQKATRELAHLGESVEPILQQALAAKPAPEARRRLKRLLEELSTLRGDRLRDLRAVEVLEQIGTPDARQLLANLTHGAPGKLTEAAQTALARLRSR
ncbi:MAG TPA: hypothetical protein VFA18_03440, partial [Gemmataceae bacterium]|nr:hypothetical protein [Gemmataceae bacterium]